MTNTATNETEFEPERRQHVPYILNGELYRIQSQEGDNVKVICCFCPPDKIYRGSVRSTGNFHMHIKRRHTALLGKLHEMKVAALLERRDRIMKNRRFAKNRKKPTPISSEDLSPASTAKADNNKCQLKIKTVFQRHKLEHNEQQGQIQEARSLISRCTSPLNTSKSPKLVSQDFDKLHNQDTSMVETITSMNSQNPPIIPAPRSVLLGRIKPENSNTITALLDGEQPEAIDLSSPSSKPTNSLFPSAIFDGKSQSSRTRSMEDVQIQLTRPQELSVAHFVHRDIMMRLDRTLCDIRQELNARNQIEQKRLLFEAAKFKYLNPSFCFE
ncbi:protein stand still [Drosophila tropicalis]|uniref:protein stand still n=1 Tax=Drosophila tropicalis TaxID=46794 RepID=UPI0035AC1D42